MKDQQMRRSISTRAGTILHLTAIVLSIILAVGCNDDSETNITPTSLGAGPGGSAIILGMVTNLAGQALASSEIHVYPAENYEAELASITVASSDGSFKITDIPVGPVDIIAAAPGIYLTQKLSGVVMSAGDNTVGIELEPLDANGYIPGILLAQLQDTTLNPVQAGTIFSEHACVILEIHRLSAIEMVLYEIDIPDDVSVLDMIDQLLFDDRIAHAQPNYIFGIQ